MGEVLERSVGVFEECLSGSPGQRACLEESLLLFLMFVDELGYQGSSVVITGLRVPEKWWVGKQSIFFIFNRNLEHILSNPGSIFCKCDRVFLSLTSDFLA